MTRTERDRRRRQINRRIREVLAVRRGMAAVAAPAVGEGLPVATAVHTAMPAVLHSASG